MSKRESRGKTLIITEDESEESNPFSFREFLRTKNHVRDEDLVDDRGRDEDASVWEEESAACWQNLRSHPDSFTSLCAEEAETSAFYDGDDDVTLPTGNQGTALQELREENISLRRAIVELRRTSDANERRVEALEEELAQRQQQEQEEARDLDNIVHSVERNLHEMTKRALRAENGVSKMKAELQQLQEELERTRRENVKLKSDERDVITAMKRNANLASDYLDKTATHAHSSISRLLEGAESLRLVSQLLRSIHKMTDVTADI
ncbi:endosome-associated-trafficking regulator 1 isoform X1 [Hippocampus zosterae]|uniref:endosome-associated-trafficking regulator 1 isoform X1 n=1 Tax=Hippocampus zosterae TaxID=109293 RepID=UPI00223E3BA5|nr:endosome-associated-trafficking regulator 1 isoform X1 [Hippocampus zosterae]